MKQKKFATQIEEATLEELRAYAKSTGRSISGVVTQAVGEYLKRANVRPTTAIFLEMNGYRLSVQADDGETFLIDHVIQKKIAVEDIATWLESIMTIVDQDVSAPY